MPLKAATNVQISLSEKLRHIVEDSSPQPPPLAKVCSMFHRQDNSCSRILDHSGPGENCLGRSGTLHEMRGTVEAIRLSQCALAAIPMRRHVKRIAYVAIYVRCLRLTHHLLQPRHIFIGTNAASIDAPIVLMWLKESHMVPMVSGETGGTGEKIHLHSSEDILHL